MPSRCSHSVPSPGALTGCPPAEVPSPSTLSAGCSDCTGHLGGCSHCKGLGGCSDCEGLGGCSDCGLEGCEGTWDCGDGVVVAVSSAGEPGEPSVNAPATGCEHAASSSSLSRRCLVVLCTAVLTPPLGSGVRGSSEAREGATVGGLGHCSEAGGRQGLCLQSSRRGTTIGRTLGRTPRQNTGQNI